MASRDHKIDPDAAWGKSGDEVVADHTLETLGYTPELSRNRSTWNVVFMCFILSSVPYGLSTTFSYPLAGGGPANVIWGWVTVSLIILCVAASLAEITSVYPTAGGVYYQTFILSPPWCRRVASWICGWAYVAGNITITLAVNFGTTLFFVACLDVFTYADGTGITDSWGAWQVFLIFLAITLLCHAIPAFGNKYLPWLEFFAIFWTLAGLLAITVCILVLARGGRHTGKWVFTHFEPQAGWPAGWSFCIGLLQAAYATSATGMIISMCEEVRQPAVQVPKAMVGTIVINLLAGLLLLIPICFVLPDLTMLVNLASGQPVPIIFQQATGSSVGAFCLLIPLLVLGIICGVGCVTATSRCTWAFARDAMTVPVAVSLIQRRRQDLKHGSFNLGYLGAFCNVVCIAWTLLAVPLFCMPSYSTVTLETMNYACVVFVGVVAISAAWYLVWGHKNYVGPPTDGVDPRPICAIPVDTTSQTPVPPESDHRNPRMPFLATTLAPSTLPERVWNRPRQQLSDTDAYDSDQKSPIGTDVRH
ncbi:conserved hypothetical protein [Aspergillus terreus NIH2624]|uniref:Uncharacterized protein n=1 Tax=Aspergillus terreus (strain NIH 2624 / FGSC A1156) TaxID=341663 RepID=Q0C7P8_ASPTN|nr:uncharacterized protein ATEG_10286 [Aspergillus terreus NIH2624]EAU29283.1 conserved hypothetical protein [Aspergillus terreus NIH2624]